MLGRADWDSKSAYVQSEVCPHTLTRKLGRLHHVDERPSIRKRSSMQSGDCRVLRKRVECLLAVASIEFPLLTRWRTGGVAEALVAGPMITKS